MAFAEIYLLDILVTNIQAKEAAFVGGYLPSFMTNVPWECREGNSLGTADNLCFQAGFLPGQKEVASLARSLLP